MTVLCPNTDEAERQSLPGGGADVRSRGRPSTSTSSASRAPSAQPPTTRRSRPQAERRADDLMAKRRRRLDPCVLAHASERLRSGSSACSDLGARRRVDGGTRRRRAVAASRARADGRPHDLELAVLHRQGHRRRVREEDRHLGRLHRGRQRQRRVLRQAPADARQPRPGRPRHHRRHRLDGEEDARPRLPAELRPEGGRAGDGRTSSRASRHPPSTRTATSRCRGRAA